MYLQDATASGVFVDRVLCGDFSIDSTIREK